MSGEAPGDLAIAMEQMLSMRWGDDDARARIRQPRNKMGVTAKIVKLKARR
jgi:hypothetical protein